VKQQQQVVKLQNLMNLMRIEESVLLQKRMRFKQEPQLPLLRRSGGKEDLDEAALVELPVGDLTSLGKAALALCEPEAPPKPHGAPQGPGISFGRAFSRVQQETSLTSILGKSGLKTSTQACKFIETSSTPRSSSKTAEPPEPPKVSGLFA